MADRIELNEQDMENVIGGILKWKGGVVYAKDNPNAKYTFTDYTACQQWILANWNSAQTEDCLKALEAAGLVHKQQ